MGRHPGGRPTKYRPIYCRRVIEYFNAESLANRYPVIAGFATSIDVTKDTIFEWSKVHPEFSESLRKALGIAEKMLMNKALSEEWHPGFAKFLAINNCNMISENQKVESNNTHTFPTGINITFIDKKESQ